MPVPLQREHGWLIENTPWPCASTPRPLQTGQTFGEVPGRALQGYYVLTPFLLENGGSILINRGFVQVEPDWLPEARKRKYNWDRRSQVLVKKL